MEQVGGPVAWKACTEQAGSWESEDEEAGGRLGKLVLTAECHRPGGRAGIGLGWVTTGIWWAAGVRESRRPARRSRCSRCRRSPQTKEPGAMSSREPSSVGLRCVSTCRRNHCNSQPISVAAALRQRLRNAGSRLLPLSKASTAERLSQRLRTRWPWAEGRRLMRSKPLRQTRPSLQWMVPGNFQPPCTTRCHR